MLKNTALRGGTDLNPDERVFAQYEVRFACGKSVVLVS